MWIVVFSFTADDVYLKALAVDGGMALILPKFESRIDFFEQTDKGSIKDLHLGQKTEPLTNIPQQIYISSS